MRLVYAGVIALVFILVIPALIGVVDELTGAISGNVDLPQEVALVLDAYPLFLLALPIIIIFMLFKRRGGTDEPDE